jgi:hypothetical protein
MKRLSRTTVRLDDGLLNQAKGEAVRRGETLTALIEEGLRLVIVQAQKKHCVQPVKFPVSNTRGGAHPGIDLNNNVQLLDIMDGIGDSSRR